MALRLEAVAVDVPDTAPVAAFWAGLLGREIRTGPGGAFLPGDDTQVGLRFVTSGAEPVGPRRMHLHLTSDSPDHQRHTVDRALRLGGRRVDVGQGPDATHVVLADPGGIELCVIGPGDTYLAGTGFLGEITCDGSRDVGLFWRDALGWPLVWNSGAQTAIQSPLGGTKLAWDSWGVPANRRNGPRFDLVAAAPAGEAERLVTLGATRRAGADLADPDGTAFTLGAGPPSGNAAPGSAPASP